MQAVIRADGARGEESPGRGYQFERSEERRVGEEGRSRWAPDHLKKKKKEEVMLTARKMKNESVEKENRNQNTVSIKAAFCGGQRFWRLTVQRSHSLRVGLLIRLSGQ